MSVASDQTLNRCCFLWGIEHCIRKGGLAGHVGGVRSSAPGVVRQKPGPKPRVKPEEDETTDDSDGQEPQPGSRLEQQGPAGPSNLKKRGSGTACSNNSEAIITAIPWELVRHIVAFFVQSQTRQKCSTPLSHSSRRRCVFGLHASGPAVLSPLRGNRPWSPLCPMHA